MDSINMNLRDLSKIPEKEFKEHFRDWMEQDDVARSLQAKLRKDLITNFNKTTLGKKIIAQAAVTHRLTLSPLVLALNTLVAEFLYAQNCHFTLSVFCTEVPYRNTLPDFESVRHFRFSEREIFEIFDALCINWSNQTTKDNICKDYSKEENSSLLFTLLSYVLNESKKEKSVPSADVEHPEEIPKTTPRPQKLDSKMDYKSNHFRYLNKYLIILSKKVKKMSENLETLQKHRNTSHSERKSVQARKFENLNRSLTKISENLRQMSVFKRKNRKLTAVVTAVDTMAKQFEKCTMNFDQISRGFMSAGGPVAPEKSYNDWIKEMRNTANGKKFLEKIESSLRKTLHREREKMERELEQRLQIQKDILKTKYKQRLAEDLAKYTARDNADASSKVNESFEKKLKEFEAKHQELQHKIQKAERRVTEAPLPRVDSFAKPANDSRGTQTLTDSTPKTTKTAVDTQDQLQQMVKTISERERHIDHIVFDAKLRVQELEHESNQLDRSFRDYLERQDTQKQRSRETATSIWQSYALGKSLLEKRSATLRSTTGTIEKHPILALPIDTTTATTNARCIPKINIDTSASVNPPAFENPFRIAQRRVLARSKTLPLPVPSTDTESSGEKHTRQQHRQQKPSVCRLIEHNDNERRTKVGQKPPLPLPPSHSVPTKVTPDSQLSPVLNMKDITLDGIELSPTTGKSSSNDSGSCSPRGVFKLRRQLFTATDNEAPSSSNVQQMNSNSNKEPEEPLKQMNTENGNNEKKSIGVNGRSVVLNEEEQLQGRAHKRGENRTEVEEDVP